MEPYAVYGRFYDATQQLARGSPFIRQFDGNFLIMKVIDRGSSIADWDITIFQRQRKTAYRLHREIIKETSFPQERVKSALGREFDWVRVFDAEKWGRPRKASKRLFFVCGKESN